MKQIKTNKFINMEKLEPILKNIKKGEIALYVVALMLVGAGYFNYTTFLRNDTEETYSEDVQELAEYENIGEAVLVSSNEFENINTENIILEENEEEEVEESKEIAETKDTLDTENKVQETEEKESTESSSDYFVSTKLERDQMYAEMLSNYEEILNNTNCSEAQKSIATQEITKINNIKNSIMICENLIQTKGFSNCVVLVNDESINVVVNIEEGLDTEKVAKIQNIISREMECEIENIHITEI